MLSRRLPSMLCTCLERESLSASEARTSGACGEYEPPLRFDVRRPGRRPLQENGRVMEMRE